MRGCRLLVEAIPTLAVELVQDRVVQAVGLDLPARRVLAEGEESLEDVLGEERGLDLDCEALR